jgi:biopolymer transport protein ExbD
MIVNQMREADRDGSACQSVCETDASKRNEVRAMSAEKRKNNAVPYINVTPLIDVLLVLLIIFMVVTPTKPSRFKALIPEPPQPTQGPPPEASILTLVVTIKQDGALELNKIGEMGSVNDTGKLSATLSELFQRRMESHAYRYDLKDRIDLPEEKRIARTVFIKAPRSIAYGEVAKVIDGIRGAGAEPVGLQIDELD